MTSAAVNGPFRDAYGHIQKIGVALYRETDGSLSIGKFDSCWQRDGIAASPPAGPTLHSSDQIFPERKRI
jgi:hypothetical protein